MGLATGTKDDDIGRLAHSIHYRVDTLESLHAAVYALNGLSETATTHFVHDDAPSKRCREITEYKNSTNAISTMAKEQSKKVTYQTSRRRRKLGICCGPQISCSAGLCDWIESYCPSAESCVNAMQRANDAQLDRSLWRENSW